MFKGSKWAGSMIKPRVAGFTLIELMVTIAVLAVIVTLAVPSFASVINGNRLTGASNEISALLQMGRMEALRRNQAVIVCPVADPEAASTDTAICTTNAPAGMKVFVPGSVVLGRHAFPGRVEASFSGQFGNRLVFRPDGFARSTASVNSFVNALISVCIPTTTPPENIRYISIESGSRITTTRVDGDGACSSPSSNSL